MNWNISDHRPLIGTLLCPRAPRRRNTTVTNMILIIGIKTEPSTGALEYFGLDHADMIGDWNALTTKASSEQELPRLPPPRLSSPVRSESEEPSESEPGIAPRDIGLEIDPKNVVSGKRRRTESTRAREGAVERPKRVQR